jgi:hypothetical protein
MKPSSVCTMTLAVICLLTLGTVPARPDTQAELEAAIKKIDLSLYRKSQADVRSFLDKLIETYWKPGQTLEVNYDCGGHAALAAMWFRG